MFVSPGRTPGGELVVGDVEHLGQLLIGLAEQVAAELEDPGDADYRQRGDHQREQRGDQLDPHRRAGGAPREGLPRPALWPARPAASRSWYDLVTREPKSVGRRST